MQQSYDVIIVGSGSSGGALAGRLSADPSCSVLVLEAGPVYSSIGEMPRELLAPASIVAAAPGHPNNWAFLGELLPGLKMPYPRGKGLGGSSSINGCYFIRGTRQDFADWQQMGNTAWGYDDVLPYYKRSENDRDYSNDAHGSSGPIPVRREPADRAPEFTQAFHSACVELGFPEDPDKNDPRPDGGVGPVPMNVADGHRVGTALGYLLPALSRPNLTVVGNASVNRVIFDGTEATGVEATVNGKTRQFFAADTVVSAGALRSPQLLMLSGIGPATHLRHHGIQVINDLPGVGQNLSDHPMISACWNSTVELPKLLHRGPLTSVLHWEAHGSQLEILPFVAKNGDMMSTSDVLGRPIKAIKALRGTTLKAVMRQGAGMKFPMLAIVVQQEDSRGSVTLASSDPRRGPVIQWNLLGKAIDRQRFRAAVEVARDVFNESALRAIGAEIVDLDDQTVRDERALDAWVAQRMSCGHPASTCRMGPDGDKMAVVDSQLRVHGVTGLRVADTSVFPTIPSRGPNATAIMVGERLADLINPGDRFGQNQTSAPQEVR
jgi:predicted dehydrogenase (TIGR03970 family)